MFKKFENPHYGMLTEIHKEFSIPASTVSNWYKHYQNDPKWRPYIGTSHGLHHRIFTDAEKQAILEVINETFIKPGKLFTDAMFIEIAMTAFLKKHRNVEKPPDFNVSEHFIHDFKVRNHIPSRTSHPKRRSDSDEHRNIEWERDIGDLLNTFPRDRILNCD